nr:hypothetical protein [Tanacetum cinerariifolium]
MNKRVKRSTSASGSKPSGDTKKNRIPRTSSSNQKNKVEDHLRSVKSSLNKKNRVSECRTYRPLVFGLGLLEAHDRTSLSDHQFYATVTPSSTLVDQDAPYASTLPTTEDTQAPVLHQDVKGQETPNAQFDNDPFANIFNSDPSSEESSSKDVIDVSLCV